MITLKLILFILIWTAVLTAFVVAFWVFPRLFLAQYCSPAIRRSVRQHPMLHLLWGLVAVGVVYWLFSSLPEKCN